MKYSHIIAAVTDECWALRETKLLAILEFLSLQASGAKFSPAEIEARIAPQTASAVARREGAVVILPLRGVIANRASVMDDISGAASAEAFERQFTAAVRDDGVKAIVIDVDSPGGAVSGCAELAETIYAARGKKPIVAHVNSTAASAAYWIASAADEVVVVPSGWVGSIGVIGMRDDFTKAMDAAGIKRTLIYAGKFKGDGYPSEAMTDAEHARHQAHVNLRYDAFVAAVAKHRGVSVEKVRDGFGQGEMVDPEPALAEGMIDRIGTLEETLQRFGASNVPSPTQRARSGIATRRNQAALAAARAAL